jgi:hypothetical protein
MRTSTFAALLLGAGVVLAGCSTAAPSAAVTTSASATSGAANVTTTSSSLSMTTLSSKVAAPSNSGAARTSAAASTTPVPVRVSTSPLRSTVSRTVTSPVAAASADVQEAGTRAATALLAQLPIKGRAPMTGYSRTQFGSAWTDANDDLLGHNGCDTRNDILGRDLHGVTFKAGTRNCTVLTGTLTDPYTAHTITFTRGVTTSTAIQIDHVVALGDAWQTGAQYLSPQARLDLANDPLELLAVDGSANEAKGDGDAATWLPPNKAYRCAYVARQVAVKARYGLWVTSAEHDAIARVLTTCTTQTVPSESGTPPTDVHSAAITASAPSSQHAAAAAPPAPTSAPQPIATPTPTPAPTPTPTQEASPAGATAMCNDGTYSYAAHHQGACSHHGGVAVFYN